VIDGQHKGRLIWDRLNLDNPNPQAVEIARRDLSAICRAVGVITPRDSTDLHDKPCEVKLTVRPAKGEYGPANEVKGYRASSGGATGSAATAPATGGATKTPPWKKAS
jgi:hypothetical protein